MFYSKPTKNEDGLYIVKAYTDDKKKYFVSVKGKAVHNTDEITFTIEDDSKIREIDTVNIEAAAHHSEEWFGKKLPLEMLERVYTKSVIDSQVTADVISATKVFNYTKDVVELDTLCEGAETRTLLEFAGLWFAKKAYGPIWNVVQVRDMTQPEVEPEVEPEPEPEVEVEPEVEEYPDEYVIGDDE
jgi:hypothetical protein